MSADMILYNGKIVTVDSKFTIAEAVAIKNGKFLAVASNAEVQAIARRATTLVDLQVKTVISGITDTCSHK